MESNEISIRNRCWMNKWKKFNVPEKEEFHRNLNMEGTTGTDYMHMRGVLKDFELKKFR